MAIHGHRLTLVACMKNKNQVKHNLFLHTYYFIMNNIFNTEVKRNNTKYIEEILQDNFDPNRIDYKCGLKLACSDNNIDMLEILMENNDVFDSILGDYTVLLEFTDNFEMQERITKLFVGDDRVSKKNIQKFVEYVSYQNKYELLIIIVRSNNIFNKITDYFWAFPKDFFDEISKEIIGNNKISNFAMTKYFEWCLDHRHINSVKILLGDPRVYICREKINKICNGPPSDFVNILISDNKIIRLLDEPLLIAGKNNNIQIVKNLFSNGHLLHIKMGNNCNRALEYACYYNNAEMVKILLDSPHISPDANNNSAIRIVSDGIRCGIEIAKLLLDDKRVSITDNDNECMRTAMLFDNLPFIKLLLEDPRMYEQDNYEGIAKGFICSACEYNNQEILKLFLESPHIPEYSKNVDHPVYCKEIRKILKGYQNNRKNKNYSNYIHPRNRVNIAEIANRLFDDDRLYVPQLLAHLSILIDLTDESMTDKKTVNFILDLFEMRYVKAYILTYTEKEILEIYSKVKQIIVSDNFKLMTELEVDDVLICLQNILRYNKNNNNFGLVIKLIEQYLELINK